MSGFWNYLVAIILFVIWIIAGGFITQSNVYLHAYKDEGQYMHTAWLLTFWAAFVTWFLVILFIIMVILAIVGVVALFGSGVGEAGLAAESTEGAQFSVDPGTLSTGISALGIGLLCLAFVLVLVNGILAALAAVNMKKSPNYTNTDPKLTKAYQNCEIAAIMSLLAAGILIIAIITYIIIGKRNKARNTKIIKEQIEERQAEYEKARLAAGQLILSKIGVNTK